MASSTASESSTCTDTSNNEYGPIVSDASFDQGPDSVSAWLWLLVILLWDFLLFACVLGTVLLGVYGECMHPGGEMTPSQFRRWKSPLQVGLGFLGAMRRPLWWWIRMVAEQESPWPVTLFSLDWIWSWWICPALKTQDQQNSGNNDQVSLLQQPNLSGESAQLHWLYLLSDPASDILEDRPPTASLPHINTSTPPLSPQSSHSPMEATTIPQAPSNAGPPQSKGSDATLSTSTTTHLLDTNEDEEPLDPIEDENLLDTTEDEDSDNVDSNDIIENEDLLVINEDGDPLDPNEDEDHLDMSEDEDLDNNGKDAVNDEDEDPDDDGNNAVDHLSTHSPRHDPIQKSSGSDTTSSSSASTATKPLHTNEDEEPIGTNEDEDTLDTNADEDPDNDSNDILEDEELLDANDNDEPLDTNKDEDPDNNANTTTVEHLVNAAEITETSPSPAFHRDGDLTPEDKKERCRQWRLFFEDIIVEGLEAWNMDMSKIEQGFAEKGCPDGEVIDSLRSAWIRGKFFPAGYKPLDGKSHAEIQQRVDDRLQRQEKARFPGFFA